MSQDGILCIVTFSLHRGRVISLISCSQGERGGGREDTDATFLRYADQSVTT